MVYCKNPSLVSSTQIMRILLDWKYTPDPHPLTSAQVIIGMAFGANQKGKMEPPGISNEAIADRVFTLWNLKKLPVIVQREVAEALVKLRLPIEPELIISETDEQFHINSFEVLRTAWEYCRNRNLRVAAIVAHPAHVLRCKSIAEKMGFSVKLPDLSAVPYEPLSKQWWTRNKWTFFFWELFARISGRIKGYL